MPSEGSVSGAESGHLGDSDRMRVTTGLSINESGGWILTREVLKEARSPQIGSNEYNHLF